MSEPAVTAHTGDVLVIRARAYSLHIPVAATVLAVALAVALPVVTTIPIRDLTVAVAPILVGCIGIVIPCATWSPFDPVERAALRSAARGRLETGALMGVLALAVASGVFLVSEELSLPALAALVRNALLCAGLSLAAVTVLPPGVAWIPAALLLAATFVFGPALGDPVRWAILLHPAGAGSVVLATGAFLLALAGYAVRGARAPA